MNKSLLRWAPILIATVLAAACGGRGSPGVAGPAGPPGPSGPPGNGASCAGLPGSCILIPSNATPATDAQAAAWAALSLHVSDVSISVNSAPVVNFKVTDDVGMPVVGLGNRSVASSGKTKFAGLTNLAFSLAKLIPAGANGSPSHWVNYIVTTVPTYKTAQPTPADPAAETVGPFPQRPSTDNTGDLVDHGDGTYTYTFFRDITTIASTVATLSDNPDTTCTPAPCTPNYVAQDKADLDDLSFDQSKVHRLTIQLAGNAPGTGTNTPNSVQVTPGVPLTHPLDVIYDFVPATGQAQDPANSGRDIVATAKCLECHQVLGGIPGDSAESSGAGFHGGSRNETRYCVVCHTEQRKYGRIEATIDAALNFTSPNTYLVDGRAVGNLNTHIHKIHMGELLAKKGYNYADVKYNEVLFPQDIRNCTKCHDGSASSTAPTAQGDNWKNAPSRRACGACHDGIDFATGLGVSIADALQGLTSTDRGDGLAHDAQADDSTCLTCHGPTADPVLVNGVSEDLRVDQVHLPVTPPNEGSALHVAGGNANTNSAWIASNPKRMPPGAIAVSYDIKSVSRNASMQPVMVFRMLQNGARHDLNDYATAVANPATGSKEIWDNFMGSPSAYFVYSLPQDGISAPADFNASVSGYLRNIWNGTACAVKAPPASQATPAGCGTLVGPDTNGYYTVTLTGVVIPDNAVMLTGGLGYSYNVTSTLPLTQTNLASFPVSDPVAGQTNKKGGLVVIAPDAQMVAGAGCPASNATCTSKGGYTGRRAIVEDARCNKCHQELGAFTLDAFHGGQRNDGTTCAWCHRPNQTSSGWSADSNSYIHAIHAGNKRANPFTWHASEVGVSFAEVRYPGVLKNCEGCHIPGSYDFSASASQSALPNRLYRTVAAGIFPANGESIPGYKLNNSSADLATSCVLNSPSVGTELSEYSLSPYVAKSTAASIVNYGIGFGSNARPLAVGACDPVGSFYSFAAAGTPGDTVEAAPTTLVISPIATPCFACHDSSLAEEHMRINGGSIYVLRSTALATQETCMVCHGPGRIADIKAMHAK
jgi:OmcA/MtrC family decaheme c-type cytochrome